MRHPTLAAVIAFTLIAISHGAWAGDILRVTIPKHSELTPVQRLNREGVDAVKRQQYEKAATLFYKAYLYDPADPFTLNNLGYISELKGELDHAQHFYALASEQSCNANIDRSNARQLEGKPMQYALKSLQDVPMRVNRMNVNAMDLLAKDRGVEAVSLLQETLSLDSKNPYTLNNLGVAEETIGDYDSALKSYAAAAESHSLDTVIVTLDRSWRGKPVSAMAAASERQLKERMKKMDSSEVSAIMFTLRGVSATNRNDVAAAKQDYLHAYSLNPDSAFSLNNRGYVAEMDGDIETAKFFYEKARKARDSNDRVGLATLHSAEGKRLFTVSADSDHKVEGELDRYTLDRRRQTGPIELIPRNNAPDSSLSAPLEEPSSSDHPPSVEPSLPQFHQP
jgi:Flp pilus assembly protein TadD